MANLWELITNASTLPVQAGTTLWNHLNNLGAGGAVVPLPVFLQSIQVEEQIQQIEVTEKPMQEICVVDYDTEITFTEEQIIGFQQ